MNIKIHKTGISSVVAFCDKELIGKVLKGENMEMKISKKFYEGEEVDEKTAVHVLKNANTINIVGEKSIRIALMAGVIEKDNIKKISGVPYAISVSL